jgi:3-hydroxy-9,10-secoandrosta-1,3,5(10)-triene-9,17-dione monooxygenase reductase component
MSKPDSRSFRRWFGGFATGVTVVTGKDRAGGNIGITINALTSLSLEPPLVLFCLVRSARVYPVLRRSTYFAVNILSEGQEYLSRHFADPRRHAVLDNIWERDQKDCPILRHTLGWMICRRMAIHKGGDHDIIIGKTVALHRRSGNLKPLLYFRGRYRKIAE